MTKKVFRDFEEADGCIYVRTLTDKELQRYYEICHNGELDAVCELRKRGL